jgi:hypothetical protein
VPTRLFTYLLCLPDQGHRRVGRMPFIGTSAALEGGWAVGQRDHSVPGRCLAAVIGLVHGPDSLNASWSAPRITAAWRRGHECCVPCRTACPCETPLD